MSDAGFASVERTHLISIIDSVLGLIGGYARDRSNRLLLLRRVVTTDNPSSARTSVSSPY